ncbi:MAG: hypothetical protein ABIR82_02020 [Nocardioides sp.]
MSRRPREACNRDERGAVAVIVAVSLTLLLVVAGLVLDFGLVRVDRQIDKSAADSATLAGLHALNTGDGSPHPYTGVCTAVRYLKANSGRFSGINESAGWKNGLGAATGNGCSDTALRALACVPSNKATWAKWQWSGTSEGITLNVTVESGYSFPAVTVWPEDALPASTPDTGRASQLGCDQLAVSVTQSRKPGLGSLATSSDLVTEIRSVGRVKAVAGDSAPAMLLLKQSGCPSLRTGSNSGGSFVHVLGFASASSGLSQPGTIHADTNGVGCTGGSNSNGFIGGGGDGVVAYAAPLVSNPTSPDPSKPGLITSVAALTNAGSGNVRDSLDNVYGSSALNTGGTKAEVQGRSLLTRGLVDDRYFPGVKSAITGASVEFALGAAGMPATGGWVKFPASVSDPCKPNPAQVTAMALTPASKLYIDCAGKFIGDNAGLTIKAGTVYFRGWVNPSADLLMPNAHHVYIGNHTAVPGALALGTGASFQVNNSAANLSGSDCLEGPSATLQKAVLFIRSGSVKMSGSSTLRMCRTTAFLLGDSITGCVPLLPGQAPTATPCLLTNNSGRGNGQFTQTGGGVNWTAPDTLDVTADPTGEPLAAAVSAWADANGPEDLALWAESGTNSSDTYNMSGGGLFKVRGVFMVPNAEPFTMSGGASLNLINAQYIASSIELNGSTTRITMSVDPNSAVPVPNIGLVGLVR